MTDVAVAFADLSGFTALTEVHGDEQAADLAEQFTALARAALGEGDRLVKSIGDAVLVTSPTAESAITLIERIRAAAAAVELFPVVRVGAHLGPVVERGGDVFGATVNLAARVAAAAGGQQVLVTRPIATAAERAGIGVVALGPLHLRNVAEPVPVFELDSAVPTTATVVDPVCRMSTRVAGAAGRLTYRGTDYLFCSLGCAAAFAADPARFVPQA